MRVNSPAKEKMIRFETRSEMHHPKLNSHIPALDGIRGIAILLVMLHHFTFYGGMRPATKVDRLFYMITTAGWVGVDLFFVLSGFLITGILYDARGADHFFRNFYIRRVLRIFPLYYGTLIAFFVILPALVPLDQRYDALAQDQIWYWSYLVNWQIGFNGWPANYAIGHFWSLAVEEQFYLIWPVAVFLFGWRKLVTICLAIIVGSFFVRVGLVWAGYSTAAYVLTPARMDSLAVGGLLALMGRSPDGLSKLSHWSWPAAAAAAALIAVIFVRKRGLSQENPYVQIIGYTLLAVLFGAILSIAITSPRASFPAKLFAHPALMFFGRYSYALYIFHHPLILAVGYRDFRVANLPALLGSQLPGQVLYTIIVGGASVVLALLSWHLYESRFLRLKARFPYEPMKSAPGVETYEVQHIPSS
jgi:peptidoglycan/LPS O-acetylase OafA/YrhL